jgi:hypothetical protein
MSCSYDILRLYVLLLKDGYKVCNTKFGPINDYVVWVRLAGDCLFRYRLFPV